jgi:hypothetical protein
MRKKNNDAVQVAALLSAQEFLAGIPVDAPKAVVDYAAGRVVALGGKPAKPGKPAKKLVAPAPVPAPVPPTPAPIPPAPNAFAVAAARAVIAHSDAAATAARKAELVAQLVEVRKLLAVKAPMLAAQRVNLLDLQAQGENIDRAVMRRREQISELLASAPEIAAYLPGDPEAVAHRMQINRYQEEIAQLRAAGAALPVLEIETLAAVTFQNEVRQLQWTQGQILNRLDALSGRVLHPWGGHLVTGGVFPAF